MRQSSLTNSLSLNNEKTWYWRGFPITYNHCGDNGPAVILVHGFGASWQHWRKNLPVLGQTCRLDTYDGNNGATRKSNIATAVVG